MWRAFINTSGVKYPKSFDINIISNLWQNFDIISYPYQYWEGIIISISYLYPYLLDTQKYLIYINSVGKYHLFVYIQWQDTSLLLMKAVNNWIEEWRGSQIWYESIANQKLMPKSCETLKHWAQNFKKSLRGTEYDNWFCGLWMIWYYIIDMTILLNISMSHIKMSTKILYHITYLNLRYNIRYLYQRYYIFNITAWEWPRGVLDGSNGRNLSPGQL